MTKTVKAVLIASTIVVGLSVGTAVLAISIHNSKDKKPVETESIATESSAENIFSENLSDHVGEILISNDVDRSEEAVVLGALQPYIREEGKAVYVSNRAVDKDLDAEGYNVYTYDGESFETEFAVIGEESDNTNGYAVVYVDTFQINTSK